MADTNAPNPVLLDLSPEGIAVVTLNRPAKRNSLDEHLIASLVETMEMLHGADHVRIVFLPQEEVLEDAYAKLAEYSRDKARGRA